MRPIDADAVNKVLDKFLGYLDGDMILRIKLKIQAECPTIDPWIPIKFRPMTDEEIQEREEALGIKLDPDEKFMFACPLPDDGQEILISTKWGVSMDTCGYGPDYGYGLEDHADWDGVLAWMPLPEKYEEKKHETD